MESGSLDSAIALIVFFGVLITTILLMAEFNGVPFALYKKLRCKLRLHKFRSGFTIRKKHYHCKYCKKPRKYPKLKLIKGDRFDFKEWLK